MTGPGRQRSLHSLPGLKVKPQQIRILSWESAAYFTYIISFNGHHKRIKQFYKGEGRNLGVGSRSWQQAHSWFTFRRRHVAFENVKLYCPFTCLSFTCLSFIYSLPLLVVLYLHLGNQVSKGTLPGLLVWSCPFKGLSSSLAGIPGHLTSTLLLTLTCPSPSTISSHSQKASHPIKFW